MIKTVRAEKIDEKKKKKKKKKTESFVHFPCLLLDLWSLNCLKRGIF